MHHLAASQLGSQGVLLSGEATVQRSSKPGFPSYQLSADGQVIADLGRFSYLNIFFGRGQRIQLGNGDRWRIRAVQVAGDICPLVINDEGFRLSQAGLMDRTYGINGKDYGYVLRPGEDRRLGRARRWKLAEHEDDLAFLSVKPRSVVAVEPVPLAAVLLSFVVAQFGIPGEGAPRIPAFRWG